MPGTHSSSNESLPNTSISPTSISLSSKSSWPVLEANWPIFCQSSHGLHEGEGLRLLHDLLIDRSGSERHALQLTWGGNAPGTSMHCPRLEIAAAVLAMTHGAPWQFTACTRLGCAALGSESAVPPMNSEMVQLRLPMVVSTSLH